MTPGRLPVENYKLRAGRLGTTGTLTQALKNPQRSSLRVDRFQSKDAVAEASVQ